MNLGQYDNAKILMRRMLGSVTGWCFNFSQLHNFVSISRWLYLCSLSIAINIEMKFDTTMGVVASICCYRIPGICITTCIIHHVIFNLNDASVGIDMSLILLIAYQHSFGDSGLIFSSWNSSVENKLQVKIHQLLLKSRFRTWKKHEADFFFVPSYVKCIRMMGGLNDKEINQTYVKVV